MFARNLLHYAADDEAAGKGMGRGECSSSRGASSKSGRSATTGRGRGLVERCAPQGRPRLGACQGFRRTWRTSSRCSSVSASSCGPVLARAVRTRRPRRGSRARFHSPNKGASPVTPRSSARAHAAYLAMLELKSALEEELCDRAGDRRRRSPPGHEELTSALAAPAGWHPRVIAHLRSLLLRMARVETMMLSQRSGARMAPVRDREVLAASREVDRMLARGGDAAAGAAQSRSRRERRRPQRDCRGARAHRRLGDEVARMFVGSSGPST